VALVWAVTLGALVPRVSGSALASQLLRKGEVQDRDAVWQKGEMAEISIWSQDDASSQGARERMSSICDVLRVQCRGRIGSSRSSSLPLVNFQAHEAKEFDQRHEAKEFDKSAQGETDEPAVNCALQALVGAFEAGGADADKAASDFGRLGGHVFLLQLLEAEIDDDDEAGDKVRELAATAVELCMGLCSRFPMKSTTVDAKNACDTMRCEIEIDSELNQCDGPVRIQMRRQSNANDASIAPAIAISNMLWAGSIVLVRYLQSNPSLMPLQLQDSCHPHASRLANILEIGAGLGAGGLGIAALARHLQGRVHVDITDFDVLSFIQL